MPKIPEDVDYENNPPETPTSNPLSSVGLFKANPNEYEADAFETPEYYHHYKRTQRNIADALQSILSLPKQGHMDSIAAGHAIVINEVKLNKACTVAHVWWGIGTPLEQEEENSTLSDIQRRLTKAKGYLAGKLVSILHLRFAPDLRFYVDKSDAEYLQFVATIEARLANGEPGKKLLEEIHTLKTLSPTRIAQIQELITDPKTKARFEQASTRKGMEEHERQAEGMIKAAQKLAEQLKKAPKISKHRQKRIDEMKKQQEFLMKQAGYDPEKVLDPKMEDVDDLGDEFLATYKHKIPNVKTAKNFDEEGKRVRNHPRDENGKKIRTKSKKAKAKQFWEGLNKI